MTGINKWLSRLFVTILSIPREWWIFLLVTCSQIYYIKKTINIQDIKFTVV